MSHLFSSQFKAGYLVYLMGIILIGTPVCVLAQTKDFDLKTLRALGPTELRQNLDILSPFDHQRVKESIQKNIYDNLDTEITRSPVYAKILYRQAKEWPYYINRIQDDDTLTPEQKQMTTEINFGLTNDNFTQAASKIQQDAVGAIISLSEQTRLISTDDTQPATGSRNVSAPAVSTTPEDNSIQSLQSNTTLSVQHYEQLRSALGRRSFPINLHGF